MRIPVRATTANVPSLPPVDNASGQVLFQVLFPLSARKGEDAFLTLLDHLVQALPTGEPVVVVLDNVGYHKSHALRDKWRQFGDRLQPHFLPAYAPQLNLIERLWRNLTDTLACHRWWNDLARLQQATETRLAGLEVHFQAAEGPAFRLVRNYCESAKWRIR